MERARAEDLYQKSTQLNLQGDYTSALPVLQEAERLSQRFSTKNVLRGKILHSLGFAVYQLEQLQEGEKYLRQALNVKRSCLPANDASTAITMDVLGDCLRQQQKFEESEQMLRQAVEMQKTVNAPAESKAITMFNLGACLHEQKKYDEAEQMLRQTLEIQATVNVPAVSQATTLDCLMSCLNNAGKHKEAEDEFLKFTSFTDLPPSNQRRRSVLDEVEESLRGQGKFDQLHELQQKGSYTMESCCQQQGTLDLRSPTHQAVRVPEGTRQRSESLVQQSATLLRGVADAIRRLEEQEEVTQIVTQENVRLQHHNEQLQQQNSQVQLERDQLQQEKDELQQEKDELQQEKDELQQAKDELQQENNHLNHEMMQLRDQLARATQPSAASGGTATRLAGRLREAEEKLEEYENVLTIAEQDVHMTTTRLGGGAFGEVFAAVWRGVPVAVKKFYEALLEVTDHNVDLFRQEISVCSRVHHPNIVSICGAITAGGIPLRLVMELLEASLVEVMTASRASGKYLSLREQIDLAVDCLCGMLYLHKLHPPLLHGDIRPTNILVTAMMEAKIGDLGTAHVMGGSLSCGPVSLDYLAPERMPRRDNTAIHNTQEADVYSLGVTLAEIFTGQQASRRSRQKQLSMISCQLLEDVCCNMTEDAAKDRITVAAALERVSPVKKEGDYQHCPAKRMVKGKLHGVQKPMLVDGPWQ